MSARCEWCLEFFDAVEQRRTLEELGALKTRLMIPDAHTPVICASCFRNVMAVHDETRIPNRILMCV